MGDSEKYFGWLGLVDTVHGLTGDKWDEVFEKSIYEFFNLLSYAKYKAKIQKQQIDKWKQMH